MAALCHSAALQGGPQVPNSHNSALWGPPILPKSLVYPENGSNSKTRALSLVFASSEKFSLAAAFQTELELKKEDRVKDKSGFPPSHPKFHGSANDQKTELSDSIQDFRLNKKNSETEPSSSPFYGHANSKKLVGLNERPSSSSSTSSSSPSMIHLSRGEWEDRAYKLLQQRRMRRLKAEKEAKLAPQTSPSSPNSSPEVAASKATERNSNGPTGVSESDISINGVQMSPANKLLRNKLSSKEGKSSIFTHRNPDQSIKIDYELLSRDLGKKGRWLPLVDYLAAQGLTQADFERIIYKHKNCLLLNVSSVKKRLDYLKSLGVNQSDIPKLILRHPQVLEYPVERTMQPRVEYFQSINISPPDLARVITKAPSLLQCSIETALKPRVRFLQEIVGVRNEDIPKVVQRSPQILAQSIENSLAPRVHFLRREVGISFQELAIMVTRHPQLLHYSVDLGMRPRINFLLKIGVPKSHIGKVLTRLTQILSLSVENSLQPKFDYLVNELGGDVYTIMSFPAYFSLSLELRIKPRHLYLNSLRMGEGMEGPFPMKFLTLTDSDFCKQIGCPSLEHYHQFRDELLQDVKRRP